MRLYRFIAYIAVCVLICACSSTPEVKLTVRQCAPLPAGGRASACACTIGDKAYVFAGRDASGKYMGDLWQYDALTDTWTDLGAAPMKARVNATIAAHGDKLYAGLGYSDKRAYHDSAYLRDWWEYTPATKQWRRLADYPSKRTIAVASFAIDGTIYALYGFGAEGFSSEICTYNIAENKWKRLPDNPGRAGYCCGGRGALLSGTYYFGTGYNTHNLDHWFAVTIETDQWQRRASLPGKGREFGACAASSNYVYLFGGRFFGGEMTGGEVFDTYLRYTPDSDRWEYCGQMPYGRAENLVAFTIAGKAYFGLGEDADGQVLDQLYRVEE